MESVNETLPPVPLKRYFSVEELCQLARVSPASFSRWQAEQGFIFGNGGNKYTRQDVLLLRKIRANFQSDVDLFSEGKTAENGEEVLTATKVRENLQAILQRLDNSLAKE